MIRLLPILLLCSCVQIKPQVCLRDIRDYLTTCLEAGITPDEMQIRQDGVNFDIVNCPNAKDPNGTRIP